MGLHNSGNANIARDWTDRDTRNAMRFGVCDRHPDTPRQLHISRITGSHGEPVQLLELTCPLCQQAFAEADNGA